MPEGSTPAPAPPTTAAAPQTDRDLYDVLMRIAADPESARTLAPHVESIHMPMEGVDTDEEVEANLPVREPVADVSALLAGLGPVVFVERDAADEVDAPTSCTCDLAQLTCDVFQAGGSTSFHFAREGAGVVLREHHWEYP